MNPNKLINFRKLSRFLAGNEGSIRSNYKGRKYLPAVTELKDLVKAWTEKHKPAQ